MTWYLVLTWFFLGEPLHAVVVSHKFETETECRLVLDFLKLKLPADTATLTCTQLSN